MSATVRQEIAEAASKVEGISCTPNYRQTTKAGDAMVRKGPVNYPDSFGGVVTWQVLVILPQDLASAQEYLDDVVPLVVAEVDQVIGVRSVTPQQLVFDGVLVPGAVIEGHRAEE